MGLIGQLLELVAGKLGGIRGQGMLASSPGFCKSDQGLGQLFIAGKSLLKDAESILARARVNLSCINIIL